MLHLDREILSQRSDDDNDGSLAVQAVNPLTMATSPHGTTPGHSWMAGSHGAAPQPQGVLDPSDDSYDIAEVMTIIGAINGAPGNADNSASENRYPLAKKLEFFRLD